MNTVQSGSLNAFSRTIRAQLFTFSPFDLQHCHFKLYVAPSLNNLPGHVRPIYRLNVTFNNNMYVMAI